MADALLHCPTCGDGPFSTPQARAGHEQRHVMERLRALEAQSRETTAVEALRGSGAQSERQPPLSAAEPEGPQPAPETGAPRPLRGSAAPEGIADAAVHDGVGVTGGEDRDDEPVEPEPDEEQEASEIDRLSNELSESEDRAVELESKAMTARREADELQVALDEAQKQLGKWQDYAKRLKAALAVRKERARLRAENRKVAPVRYCYYWCSNPECDTAVRYIFHKGDPRFSDPARRAERCEECEGVLIWVAAAENLDEVEGIAREARAYISVILQAPDDVDAYLDAIMGSDTWRAGGPAQQHLSDLSNRFYNAHDADTGNEFFVKCTTRELRRVLLWLILTGELPDQEPPGGEQRPHQRAPARSA